MFWGWHGLAILVVDEGVGDTWLYIGGRDSATPMAVRGNLTVYLRRMREGLRHTLL